MQLTPESTLSFEGCKDPNNYEIGWDSGFSGFFHSPHSGNGGGGGGGDDEADCCRPLSPSESHETSKENIRLPAILSDRSREAHGSFSNDHRGRQQLPTANWYETPKREFSLRQRLLMCRASQAVKPDNARETEPPAGASSDPWLNESFNSFNTMLGALGFSALHPDKELPLSTRERRFMFTQVRTSTLDDGKVDAGRLSSCGKRMFPPDAEFMEDMPASDQIPTETPTSSKFLPTTNGNLHSPISGVTTNPYDSSIVLYTPSSTPTHRYIRYEDSGFGSPALDKTQDDSVDYDGSFQELLFSASKGTGETPNLAGTKRRSRLQRQHRLSTLQEGGSQSEEQQADRKRLHQDLSQSADDVFADVTPHGVPVISQTSLICATQAYATPLQGGVAKAETETPVSSASTIDLSLTPALELVHALCQQKVQTFVGQSPSLKDELKYTVALTKTPSTFRTAMPLAGLIGRRMGLVNVDILSHLMNGNFRHILVIIFHYMTPQSICSCCQVSKSWREIIQQDENASLMRISYLKELAAASQKDGPVHVTDAETRLMLHKRSPLTTVQAQSRSQGSPLTLSQNAVSRSGGCCSKQERFLEVAKTLSNDECLKPCPRCQYPARCHAVKREGVCTRADCGFCFCTACLCAFHSSRECGSQSVGRRKRDDLLPGSAQSKRNVRRL